MKNFMTAFNIELHEIIISDLQEGIFYSKLVCSSDNDTVEIDSPYFRCIWPWPFVSAARFILMNTFWKVQAF